MLYPYNWPADFLPLLLWLTAAGLLAGGAYLGCALALRLPEAQELVRRIRNRTENQRTNMNSI